jgi:MerR HTH family regulatory protein
VIISCAQHAEAVHDLVRYESSVDVPCAAMLVVVVALPTFDVVGQRLRDLTGVAVLRHNVGYMVADHAAEPAALVSHVHPVVTDVPGAESQRPFTTDEVAALLNVPLDTIHEWHKEGTGPPGYQGHEESHYRRIDVVRWLIEQGVTLAVCQSGCGRTYTRSAFETMPGS